MSNQKLSIEDLSALADVPIRTVRYYIQRNLIERPEGARRGAFYTSRHLDQLLTVRKWVSAGLSLERIEDLMAGEPIEVPPPRRQPGDVRIASHLYVHEGVEIVIDPNLANLSPEEVRSFAREVMNLYSRITQSEDSTKKGEKNE